MAQVPYTGVPQAEAQDRPTPYFHINAISDAFGVGIGRAISEMGTALQHSGDVLFGCAVALQQVRNESDADDAATQFIIQSSDIRSKYMATEGKDSPDSLMAHNKSLEDLREKIRGGLSNPDSQRRYDGHTRGYLAREVYSASMHAATQNKVYNKRTIEATRQGVYDEVTHNPDSNSAVKEGKEKLRAANRREADIHGLDEQQADFQYRKDVSQMLYRRITSMATNKPFEADKLLNAAKEHLLGEDFPKAQKIVDDHMRINGSRIIAEGIVKPPEDGKFEKPLSELLADGAKEAEKIRPGD